MANPAPTINQINAFNVTQGTTIGFNIIGGTELVRSNKIYIYDLSDNSLICTHLYVSTESIHELPANTDGSIVYESGKSSADFVNGAQYYAQIQTFTDIAGTQGGSGLSVSKLFWCLVDPSLTIATIPSSISTTSYNVSATYDANTSVVSNIIQQYQFNLYSATGSLLQSSGVVVGNGEQQGTSTAYDISYNFSGLSVGSSYYVVVDVTTTQGMSVSAQSGTFTVSIDTPTLGEATVVNNACDGYISVTSNLSSEYGGSGSGEIVSFETDSENVFTKLQVNLDPIQDLHGYDAPWVGGAGKNLYDSSFFTTRTQSGVTITNNGDGSFTLNGTASQDVFFDIFNNSSVSELPSNTYRLTGCPSGGGYNSFYMYTRPSYGNDMGSGVTFTNSVIGGSLLIKSGYTCNNLVFRPMLRVASNGDDTFAPYENICPISGHDEVDVEHVGANLLKPYVRTGTTSGLSFSINEDGSVTLNGTTTNTAYINIDWSNNSIHPYDLEPFVGQTMYASLTPSLIDRGVGNLDITAYKMDGTQVTLKSRVDNGATFVVPNTAKWGRTYIVILSGATFNNETFYPLICLDSSSDKSWKPYNEQTYHQDIEATYTPTVQENEAYLFKKTGDVRGDRESLELVGGTVAWNQLVLDANRNFTSAISDTRPFTLQLRMFGSPYTTAFVSNVGLGKGVYTRLFVGIDTQGSGLYLTHNGQNTNIEIWRNTNQQLVVGHKYLFNVNVVNNDTSTVGGLVLKDMMLIDLTAMFGSTIADYIYTLEQGQAGAGVAFFRKLFPKPYYAYNAGELMSVQASSHDTTGFNQWDEEWENGWWNYQTGVFTASSSFFACKSKIAVFPNTKYYWKCPTNVRELQYYDANGEPLGSRNSYAEGYANTTFTTPDGCYYLTFYFGASYGTTYKNDICINLSWDGERDGEYEAYVKHSYPLDSSLTLRGIPKLDASNNLYYDGDTYESDGTVTRKYGVVDLGTLTWDYDPSVPRFYVIGFSDVKPVANNSQVASIICPKYYATYYNNITNADKGIAVTSTGSITVHDSTYTDKATFKTAMSGVYLVYELATPTTETADAFEEIQKVTPIYGTEEFVTTSIVPVGNNTQYYTRDIYGGYIDLVSGELVVTHGLIDLGTRTYSKESESVFYADLTSLSIKSQPNTAIASDVISSSYATKSVNSIQTSKSGVGYYTYSGNGHTYLYIGDSRYSTGADLKQALNGVQLVYPLAAPITYQLTPQQIQTLVGVNNVWSEQGDVELSYHIPITNLLVKRQDVADVSGDWLTLYSQPITQASDMDFTFIDFTNQYGKTYKYALVPLLTQTQSGVEVEVEGGYTVSDEVQSVFDGVFIGDSTGVQRLKAGVAYNNLNTNQQVGVIPTLGNKYPVIVSNGNIQYDTGSVSGLIVPDDFYSNGNLSRIDMSDKRGVINDFITNKKPKILKDWNGNIWLVVFTDNVDVSFDNNYGMGIATFTSGWTEVGDPTNQEDLQRTGLINVGGD